MSDKPLLSKEESLTLYRSVLVFKQFQKHVREIGKLLGKETPKQQDREVSDLINGLFEIYQKHGDKKP